MWYFRKKLIAKGAFLRSLIAFDQSIAVNVVRNSPGLLTLSIEKYSTVDYRGDYIFARYINHSCHPSTQSSKVVACNFITRGEIACGYCISNLYGNFHCAYKNANRSQAVFPNGADTYFQNQDPETNAILAIIPDIRQSLRPLVKSDFGDITLRKASSNSVVIIGGGAAGLMAAEVLSQAGVEVHLYDAMPSVGRKILLAGVGGLNLTHAEPFVDFVARYGKRQAEIEPLLNQFTPQMLRNWAADLGIETFVGSSQRVFPVEMKAAPLLRAWLRRLRAAGVQIHTRHRWTGWDENKALRFSTPDGEKTVIADTVILALGGGSWAKLGSDGKWLPLLAEKGITIAPLQPANCGFDVAWSDYFRDRFAAQPLKSVALSFTNATGKSYQKQGELMLTATGVEGSLIYAFSAPLRDAISANGSVIVYLDLAPDKSQQRLVADLSKSRGSKSISNHLRSRTGIEGAKAGLLREFLSAADFTNMEKLAAAIKALPITLIAPRPIDEAISTAGGVCFESLNANLMLKNMPGVFCAGEMLDWEAPTGGYLLTACFASGRAAGFGALKWLQSI